ncbi:VanZ family protein [Bacillus shivajii]|uniref:VanZ family protein n=1 Tax=Bacillus shivajii TaxID=1983719 RepID=UPI001CF93F54|nr:VanZ family protein [Bacillus shivajii]UCZ52894.1 VanZ family protein [Bacillus shivajii]
MFKVISWVAVILWMALIFYLSHQPAGESSELSSGVTALILSIIEGIVPAAVNVDFDIFHFYIRKGAHFAAYFVLGLFVVNALYASGVKGLRSVLVALLISVLYAASDEYHQTFIPGRSGEVSDVLIDAVGSATGIVCYLLAVKLIQKLR